MPFVLPRVKVTKLLFPSAKLTPPPAERLDPSVPEFVFVVVISNEVTPVAAIHRSLQVADEIGRALTVPHSRTQLVVRGRELVVADVAQERVDLVGVLGE